MSDKLRLAMLAKESDQGHTKRLSSKASITYLVCKRTLAPTVCWKIPKEVFHLELWMTSLLPFLDLLSVVKGKLQKSSILFFKN